MPVDSSVLRHVAAYCDYTRGAARHRIRCERSLIFKRCGVDAAWLCQKYGTGAELLPRDLTRLDPVKCSDP